MRLQKEKMGTVGKVAVFNMVTVGICLILRSFDLGRFDVVVEIIYGLFQLPLCFPFLLASLHDFTAESLVMYGVVITLNAYLWGIVILGFKKLFNIF